MDTKLLVGLPAILNLEADFQTFILPNYKGGIKLKNKYIPTDLVPTQTFLEFLNSNDVGFRLQHDTIKGSVKGDFSYYYITPTSKEKLWGYNSDTDKIVFNKQLDLTVFNITTSGIPDFETKIASYNYATQTYVDNHTWLAAKITDLSTTITGYNYTTKTYVDSHTWLAANVTDLDSKITSYNYTTKTYVDGHSWLAANITDLDTKITSYNYATKTYIDNHTWTSFAITDFDTRVASYGYSTKYYTDYSNLLLVAFVSTTNITNIASATIPATDGYTPQNGDLFLATGQTIASENGVRVYKSNNTVNNQYCSYQPKQAFVLNGTVNTGNTFINIATTGNTWTNSSIPTFTSKIANFTTQTYVDNSSIVPVAFVSTTNIANIASATIPTIDGYTPQNGDYFAATGQTTASENGVRLYTAVDNTNNASLFNPGNPLKAIQPKQFYVLNGTANSGKTYVNTAPNIWATPASVSAASVKSILHGYVGTTYSSNLVDGDHIKFDSTAFSLNTGGIITLDASTAYNSSTNTSSLGRITLQAGKTYKLISSMCGFIQTYFSIFRWYNSDTNIALGTLNSWWMPTSGYGQYATGGLTVAYITPAITTRVELRITRMIGSINNILYDVNSVTWFTIETI